MNYKKIYFAIIKNRRANPLPLDTYGEEHHIIPRSFGGGNNKANLVRLTAREHFVVHFLLYKMYKYRSQVLFPNSQIEAERYRKMAYAFNLMMRVKSKDFAYINSHVFEQIRQEINLQYKKYTKKQVKEMYDFYVNNKLNTKTIHIFHKKFNTTLSIKSIQMIFYRNGFLLTNHETYKHLKVGTKKYNVDEIKKMFDFCITNKITAKNIHLVNDEFDTDLLYDSLKRLFVRHGFRLSDYEFFRQRNTHCIKYSKEQVQKMFRFYVKNKITKHNVHIFNEHFNMQLSYSGILKLFQRNGFKLSNHIFYKKNKYSKKMIKEMFQFYVENKINSKTMDILNEKFNTSFNRKSLTELFRSHDLKLSKFSSSSEAGVASAV